MTTENITLSLEKLSEFGNFCPSKCTKSALRNIATNWSYENDQECRMETEKERKQTK